ncbi:hypothetical protein LTS14_001905 [Recurvomyces mirabilis]|uniref:uncharacterized protein n=1 Tax=Recurvomyces mirabilis TaxID=574656 RepID=UPI002DDF266F|nr:hypothetical protein LTS14_001905 [Recurvomyces mirabilis]
MSQYGQSRGGYDDDDGPRRYHSVRTRPRGNDEPDYVREETYIERGKGAGPRDLVFRGRDDSVEDIPRDFPPPGRNSRRNGDYDDYNAPPRRAKSARGGRYDDDYDDDRSTVYGAGAGGAAGYAAGRRGDKRDRRRRDDRDYDSDYSDSPPPRRHERKKSGIQETLEGLGLGGIVGAALGKKDKDKDRSSSRDGRSARSGRSRSRANRGRYSDEDSRSRSRGGGKQNERKWAQAAQAALVAGAVEAFRSRKEAGPWTGEKGKRIATAAFGAGGIDGFLQGKKPEEKSKIHLAEAVIGGLAVNRLANGSRSKSRGPDGRGRDYSPDSRAGGGLRSRSRSVIDRFRGRSASRGPGARSEAGEGGGGAGALKGLVAGGAVAAAGKAIYDRVRSKSRKRRSPSNSSADSYVPSRNRRRDKRRSPPSDTDDRSTRRSQAGTARGQGQDRGINGRDVAAGGAAGAGAGALVANRNRGQQQNGNDGNNDNKNNNNNESKDGEQHSDSSSTTDMENKRKHMKGKELLTAGLATIATIHAAHGVYSSMESHEKRHRLVAEGEMSPEEARKKQTKAWVQDAAAVGIAALGIKGAFSEWKEMNEQRYAYPNSPPNKNYCPLIIALSFLARREIHEIEKRKRERRKRLEQRKRTEEHQRQEQMMNVWSKNPMMAMQMHTMQQSMQGNGQGMPLPMMPQGYGGGGGGGGGGGQGQRQQQQPGTYWQRLYGTRG